MAQHRLFVALPLPDAIGDALLDTMEGLPGARWEDADNLHITLRFIGEVDRHQFDDIVTALESVAFRPFPVTLAGVSHFERKGRPHAIWARVVPSTALAHLQISVEMACRRAGLPAETRKFLPHVTLARLKAGSGPVSEWIGAQGRLALGPWQAEGFALFESNLTPNGVVYSQLATFPRSADSGSWA